VVIHFDWLTKSDRNALDWYSDYTETFLVLQEGTNIKEFDKKIAKHYDTVVKNRGEFTLFAQQYSDRYLYGKYEDGKIVGGRIEYVKLFPLVAFFILLIACINFINLSTAQASKKMKEVGIKKTIGASRKVLMTHFFSASTAMVLLSSLVAILATLILLPHFNTLTSKQLTLQFDLRLLTYIAIIIALTSLLAGMYPALYLSKLNPLKVLKNRPNTSWSELFIRKGLVIFQFSLSVIFIVGIFIIGKQMQYIQSKNLGYDKTNVLCFQRPLSEGKMDVFLNEIKEISTVENVSNMHWSILDGTDSQTGFSWSGKASEKQIEFKSPRIGYDVVETLDMKLLAGRSFSRVHQDEQEQIIINRTAQELMELEDPIGQIISKGISKKQIIGVVEDFHYGSIHKKIEPTILRFRDSGSDVMVKIIAGQEMASIQALEKVFKEFHPDHPFTFTFLNEDYQSLYQAEERVTVLSKYFGLLAILTSCLGLFGLSTFTAEQRAKEIGIRKILGASIASIANLLSKDFLVLVIIGLFIASPLAYYFMSKWLQNFAYHIEISWWMFVLAGVPAIGIALLTVSFQSIKTALANPINALRNE